MGITSTEKIFSIYFSFSLAELTNYFKFIFEALKEECFINVQNITLLCILLSDQASGLPRAVAESIPDVQQQWCNWHIVAVKTIIKSI